jgi:hypothetical protein
MSCVHYSDEQCEGCAETSPGTCPQCATARPVCQDCGCWLECGECGDAADCGCEADEDDEEQTAVIAMRCSFGHVTCVSENICRQSRESRFVVDAMEVRS